MSNPTARIVQVCILFVAFATFGLVGAAKDLITDDGIVFRFDERIPYRLFASVYSGGKTWELGRSRPEEWEAESSQVDPGSRFLRFYRRLHYYEGLTIDGVAVGWNPWGVITFVQTDLAGSRIPAGIGIGDRKDAIIESLGVPTAETASAVEYMAETDEPRGVFLEFDVNDELVRITIYFGP